MQTPHAFSWLRLHEIRALPRPDVLAGFEGLFRAKVKGRRKGGRKGKERREKNILEIYFGYDLA